MSFVTHESHGHADQTVCSYKSCVHVSAWLNALCDLHDGMGARGLPPGRRGTGGFFFNFCNTPLPSPKPSFMVLRLSTSRADFKKKNDSPQVSLPLGGWRRHAARARPRPL